MIFIKSYPNKSPGRVVEKKSVAKGNFFSIEFIYLYIYINMVRKYTKKHSSYKRIKTRKKMKN